MTHQAPLHKQQPSMSLSACGKAVPHLGALCDDHVIIRSNNKAADPPTHVITINCTDRLSLACDVSRTILEFGLDVVQADFSTDGRWCFLLFWVIPKSGSAKSVKWALLKERLILECPSPSSSLYMQFSSETCTRKKKIYLLQTCSTDRLGILNDIVHTLWRLELEILKVNALTSPNGSAVNVFLLCDIRSESQDKRKEAICKHVKSVLGASHSFCELILASIDDVNETFDLEMLHGIPDELIKEDLSPHVAGADAGPNATKFSLNMDNSLSPGHTLLQITHCNRRGLLYDCLRALSDLNLQISYGRLATTPTGIANLELFVSQANGTKLLDPDKQRSLQTRLRLDVCEPIRVMIVKKGSHAELLVATTVEKCGRARPCILDDVTLALKMLQIGIFKADNEKICHGDRMWELYRFLLVEQPGSSLMSSRMRTYVVERVKSVLIS